MQMANELDRLKTFHKFKDSNYFWREKTLNVILKLDDFWEIFFYT